MIFHLFILLFIIFANFIMCDVSFVAKHKINGSLHLALEFHHGVEITVERCELFSQLVFCDRKFLVNARSLV